MKKAAKKKPKPEGALSSRKSGMIAQAVIDAFSGLERVEVIEPLEPGGARVAQPPSVLVRVAYPAKLARRWEKHAGACWRAVQALCPDRAVTVEGRVR